MAYLKAYYDENKEKISDYHKKYYEKNKSKNITENKTETTHNKPINPKTKEPYKTPEYIRQAIKKYKDKMKQFEPEKYKAKLKQQSEYYKNRRRELTKPEDNKTGNVN